ncbi:MAG: TadE/TadG family type IV pilus assembly protein [Ruegeria sp.]
MITKIVAKARRFCRGEGGNPTVEFMLIFPAFIWLTYSGVEFGILAFKHANLERALDETIRDVRLNKLEKYTTNTSQGWTHDLLKSIVCDKAIIPDCAENIALEMTPIDQFLMFDLEMEPYCVDTPKDVRPSQTFNPGAPNELMIIRACHEVKPLWSFSRLGQLAKKDPDAREIRSV